MIKKRTSAIPALREVNKNILELLLQLEREDQERKLRQQEESFKELIGEVYLTSKPYRLDFLNYPVKVNSLILYLTGYNDPKAPLIGNYRSGRDFSKIKMVRLGDLIIDVGWSLLLLFLLFLLFIPASILLVVARGIINLNNLRNTDRTL